MWFLPKRSNRSETAGCAFFAEYQANKGDETFGRMSAVCCVHLYRIKHARNVTKTFPETRRIVYTNCKRLCYDKKIIILHDVRDQKLYFYKIISSPLSHFILSPVFNIIFIKFRATEPGEKILGYDSTPRVTAANFLCQHSHS